MSLVLVAFFGRLVIHIQKSILSSNISTGSIIDAYYESKNVMLYMNFPAVTSVNVGNIVFWIMKVSSIRNLLHCGEIFCTYFQRRSVLELDKMCPSEMSVNFYKLQSVMASMTALFMKQKHHWAERTRQYNGIKKVMGLTTRVPF